MSQTIPQKTQKLYFQDFEENLLHLYVLFLLEYGNTNGFLAFCKNEMSGKNVVLELWSKNLWSNQNAGVFKIQYLTNKLNYEV